MEESRPEDWHRAPPKLIDQERFIINIKQKHKIASHIADSLQHLQVQIPSIEQLKRDAAATVVTSICPKMSITAALNARGSLFLGAMDGRLFY